MAGTSQSNVAWLAALRCRGAVMSLDCTLGGSVTQGGCQLARVLFVHTDLAGSNGPMRRVDPWLLVILIATLLIYARALWNGFAQDDVHLVQVLDNALPPNPMVAQWQGVAAYFGSHYWHGIYDKGDLYRPLTVLSYAATHAICGAKVLGEAFPHHLGNLTLHLLCVVLVHGLLARLGVARAPRLLATAVFALHAIRSEAVAGIVGRAELFAFGFGALAARLLITRDEFGGARRFLTSIGTGLALFLAFCSKESALAWVPFLVCMQIARRVPIGMAFLVPLAHALLPLLAYFLLRSAALQGILPAETVPIVNPLVELTTQGRIATAAVVQLFALGKTLLPLDLVCEYGMSTFTMRAGFADLGAVFALLLQAGLAVAGVLAVRRRPLLFLAVVAFFGFAFLTANFTFPTGVIFAERLMYAPALGLTFLAAAVGATRIGLVLGLVWLIPSCVEIGMRVPVWQDDERLFTTDAERNPRAVRLLTSAAKVLRDKGLDKGLSDIDRAITHLQNAVALVPQYALGWNNLGAMYLDSGRTDLAIQALRRGLLGTLRTPGEDEYRLKANLGSALLRKGERTEAIALLVQATTLQPGFRPAWLDLFAAVDDPKDPRALDAELSRAQRLAPGDPRVAFYRGVRALDADRSAEAEGHLAQSLRGEPDHWPASFAYAEALKRQGKKAQAKDFLGRLAGWQQAPLEVRARAREVMAQLGS